MWDFYAVANERGVGFANSCAVRVCASGFCVSEHIEIIFIYLHLLFFMGRVAPNELSGCNILALLS